MSELSEKKKSYGQISYELLTLARHFYGLNRENNFLETEQIVTLALNIVAKDECFSKGEKKDIIQVTKLFSGFSLDELFEQKKNIQKEIDLRELCKD